VVKDFLVTVNADGSLAPYYMKNQNQSPAQINGMNLSPTAKNGL